MGRLGLGQEVSWGVQVRVRSWVKHLTRTVLIKIQTKYVHVCVRKTRKRKEKEKVNPRPTGDVFSRNDTFYL